MPTGIYPRPSLSDRFWSKVEIDTPEKCWNWKASKYDSRGYGCFSLSHDKMVRAPRMAWILTRGEIPEGLCVCHSCDNPSCVNPSHLWIGTIKDNTQDMILKGRVVYGNKGKKFSEESKKRMSEGMKGRVPWNKGKHTGNQYSGVYLR